MEKQYTTKKRDLNLAFLVVMTLSHHGDSNPGPTHYE